MKATVLCILVNLLMLIEGKTQTFRLGGIAPNGVYMGFLQFLPDGYASSGQLEYPLIISLHGIGEKGNNSTELSNVQCCGIPDYIRKGNKMRFSWNGKWESFIVLTPQLDKRFAVWQNFYVDELINYALRTLKVDPDRIFISGLSLGGGGCWSYASSSLSNARILAGIVPVVAPCFVKDPCIIAEAGLPVFALHALNDTIARSYCTSNTIKRINACDAKVTPNAVYYTDGGHLVFQDRTYDTGHKFQNPNVYEWMLAQNRTLLFNKKPIARLKATTSITMGKGLILLDATASTDPDGKLVGCSWISISGPQKAQIYELTPGKAQTTGLTAPGEYVYAVKVVDDRAEWSLDTVSVTLTSATTPINIAPVAAAGNDVSLILPGAAPLLNSAGSRDADGQVSAYKWSQIYGPSPAVLADPYASASEVQQLQAGTYYFRLQVMDDKGAITADTMRIFVSGIAAAEEQELVVKHTLFPAIAQQRVLKTDPVFQIIDPNTTHVPTSAKVVLYPNPATNSFSVKLPRNFTGKTSIKIYTTGGYLIKAFSASTIDNISIEALPAGFYYVEIYNPGNPLLRCPLIKR